MTHKKLRNLFGTMIVLSGLYNSQTLAIKNGPLKPYRLIGFATGGLLGCLISKVAQECLSWPKTYPNLAKTVEAVFVTWISVLGREIGKAFESDAILSEEISSKLLMISLESQDSKALYDNMKKVFNNSKYPRLEAFDAMCLLHLQLMKCAKQGSSCYANDLADTTTALYIEKVEAAIQLMLNDTDWRECIDIRNSEKMESLFEDKNFAIEAGIFGVIHILLCKKLDS